MYLDWESRPEDYFAIDIETDSLDATVIWVMCWENIKTREIGKCIGYDEIRKFLEAHSGSFFIGHNIIKFDAPVLNRLAGTGLDISRLIDTLVLSTLYSPSLDGGHGLGNWGKKLGFEKLDFEDFSRLTPRMITYCHQDVKITAILFRRLSKTLARIGFSEKTCEIQHKIIEIITRQQQTGFYFDGPRAIVMYNQLRAREEELKGMIYHAFPPRRTLVAERKLRKQDGGFTSIYEKDALRYSIEFGDDGTSYRAFEDVEFNLGSPAQRVEKLLELGWKPEDDEKTAKGSPQPFKGGELAKSLEAFLEENDVPEVRLIAKWMAINGRANMINTWLNEWNENDHCIHGKLFVADTLRFRHQAPNTANIPAVRVEVLDKGTPMEREVPILGEEGYFTYEARDLWCARPKRTLVGTDAAGLELRMLAHYLNRPDFTKQVVEGDPHQYNADLAGVSRPLAKTLIYAIQYGAQGPKVGKIIGGTAKEGAELRETFLARLGIKGVMDSAIHEQKTGRVWLVDGAGLVCPSPHAALNYKLQGGGARVMAQGAIFLDQYIRSAGLDSLKVGDIHDEWQFDVAPGDAREHARLSVQAIRDAGEELNLNVPLDGTAKEGLTWAETH